MRVAVAFLVVAMSYGTIQAYDNWWDGPLHKECGSGHAFYRWYSYHDNGREDRRWTFYCKYSPQLAGGQTYRWYYNVNYWDGVLNFKCSDRLPGSLACGVRSYHDNYREDRRWSFKCCKPSSRKICQVKTYMTGFVNYFDGVINWQTPYSNQYMVGFYSYHCNRREDRRWKVYYGRLTCSDKCACTGKYGSDWEVHTVNYQLSRYTKVPQKPEVVATKHIDNYSKRAETTVSVSLSGTVTDTSTFTSTRGTSMSITGTFTAKIPFVGKLGVSVSAGKTSSQSWGRSNSKSKTMTTTFSLKVPPNTHVVGKAIVSKAIIKNLPFTMTLRHKSYGCRCTVKGLWHGVQHYNLRHLVVDREGHEKHFKEP